MQYTKPCSRYLDASRGVVRSVSVNAGTQRPMYAVERMFGKRGDANNDVIAVSEDELAFAVRCLVYVAMEEGEASEMEGEVIGVKPLLGENGTREMTHTVPVVTENGYRVEEGVAARRVRYQFALRHLQARIGGVASTPRHRKGVAIRTNDRGEPILNRQYLQASIEEAIPAAEMERGLTQDQMVGASPCSIYNISKR